ncbi:glycosyltransferase [Dyadobacter tibetensis]|uniref:glycosyltransferase n=1 Tax=Dyadobacter tibetensis TaxID=1211851 RepID=UPI00046EAD3D|nr:glycosyltransferase [Dyadobacter tibetensis]
MISIVICSVDPVQLRAVKANISATIGVPYELLAYDNRNQPSGICEVYNKGIASCRYAIVCLMHEDVAIQTQDWGKIVLDIFDAHPGAGILGVAGGGYKSLTPSGWYCLDFQFDEKSFQNILQGYKYDNREPLHAYHNPYQQRLSEVVCVDGVWICVRTALAKKKPFDSQLLKGFHGYDIDFCLSHYGDSQILVTYDILMVHESEGNFNKKWLDEVLKIHEKWSSQLPLTTANISERDLYFTEKRAIKRLIEQMLLWEYDLLSISKMIMVFGRSKRISSKLVLKAFLHLLSLQLGTKKLSAD